MTGFITPHCISAYLVHQTQGDPRYLLIRRCGDYLPGTWQMISGGIIEGETAPEAALREIQEETGLIPTAFYSADSVETFYMPNRDKITFAPVFVGFVEHREVILSPQEHDVYEWLSFKEAQTRLTFSEQKRAIEHIHKTYVLQKPNELFRIKI